jgi:hypothetical protein
VHVHFPGSCRSIAALQPPLAQQLAAAAAAAAASQSPALLSKLQDAQSALNSKLTAAAASAAAAAAAAHSLDSSADPEDACYSDAEDAAAAEASKGCYQLPLAQHWLVADAVMGDAAAAWQAYEDLMAHMQLIADR